MTAPKTPRPPLPPLITLLLAAALLRGAGGCRKHEAPAPQPQQAREGLIMGFSQIGAESAWRRGNTRSVREAAEAAGIQLLFSNAEQKQENQIKALRSFIAYQVDVIAFVPIVSTGWDNVLREAKDAGIPVLVTDRKIDISDESLYAGFIGTDSVKEGREAGLFLLDKFAGLSAGEEVRIAEFAGTAGSSVAEGRGAGFREALAGRPEFRIVYSECGDFLRSRGYEIMKKILADGPAIGALFSHNDSMTLGAMDALKEAGLRPGRDVVIITIDAEQAAIDALKAGEVNCVIECNPKLGPAIMDLARKLAAGETVPRLIHVEEAVFREGDDLTGLPPRGY